MQITMSTSDRGRDRAYRQALQKVLVERRRRSKAAALFNLVRHDGAKLSPAQAREIYDRDQLLWIKLPKGTVPSKGDAMERLALPQLNKDHPDLLSDQFSVENVGDYRKSELRPNKIYSGPKGCAALESGGPFYVSSILQRHKEGVAAFLDKAPLAEAPIHGFSADDGIWLFMGRNPARASGSMPETMKGRPEHVDAVDHAGTWHVQMAGSKTWHVRPCADAEDWAGAPPRLPDRGARLRIEVQRGDLLVINTRAWYHATNLEAQPGIQSADQGFSISYARDFYRDGDRKAAAAAAAATAAATAAADNSKGGKLAKGRDGKDDMEKTNLPAQLDPRLLAANDVFEGDVALDEDDLPDSVPRSRNPNCELCVAEIDGDERVVLLALRWIFKGEPLTIATKAGEEYEEMEMDPTTGEIFELDEEADDVD